MPTSPRYSKPEIERRWLVEATQMLDAGSIRERRIEDRYILGTRLRLRKVSELNLPPIFKLGKKYESEIIGMHQVVTTYLSEDEYRVFARLPARVARKRRVSVHGGSLDVYEYPELISGIFEVEFESPEEAASYIPPEHVGKEVTNAAEYSGFALARSEA